SIVDNMKVDMLVGSGGVLSHAPRMEQTAMMLIDSFEPEGITTLTKDSIFMMPHLGVLAQVHPKAAMEVFDRDCLIYLGTCIAPAGRGKPGKRCFSYSLKGDRVNESGEIAWGEMKRIRLGVGETADIVVQPARGFDAGAGPERRVARTICGGTVGVILDGRGRPLQLPEDSRECRRKLQGWYDAVGLYPEATAVAV
ncbi:MAG: glutamate mutase L, partial [Planctomycetes bacterium]|nr:glutamate mutase L [Planctomycetota bacterium]